MVYEFLLPQYSVLLIPGLLYGLDVIRLTKADVTKFTSYYIQLL